MHGRDPGSVIHRAVENLVALQLGMFARDDPSAR